MPVEQLRPILLIGLAVVGFLLWQEWQEDFGPGARREPAPAVRDTPSPRDLPDPGRTSRRDTAADTPAAAPARTPAPGTGTARSPDVPSAQDVPTSTAEPAPAPTAAPAGTADVVTVRTDVLGVRIDPRGGTIWQVALARYPIELEEPDRPFVLLDDRAGLLYVAESGIVGASAPDHHAVLVPERNDYELAPGTDRLDVRLHWESEDGSGSPRCSSSRATATRSASATRSTTDPRFPGRESPTATSGGCRPRTRAGSAPSTPIPARSSRAPTSPTRRSTSTTWSPRISTARFATAGWP